MKTAAEIQAHIKEIVADIQNLKYNNLPDSNDCMIQLIIEKQTLKWVLE